jgi:aspartyl-tRNA synthetase
MEIAHREIFQRRGKSRAHAKLKIEEGDLILFAADQWLTACEILGKIRCIAPTF